MPDEQDNDLHLSRDDWRKDRSMVISNMRRMSDSLDKLTATVTSDLTNMKIEQAVQRTKTTLYAAIISAVASALLAAFISITVSYIRK
jgi:hypothetical protein